MATKIIECTGSPKPFFKDKAEFLSKLTEFGYEHGKMSKRDNKVTVLATDNLSKSSNKMTLAKELGVEIMSYEQLADAFGLL